MERERRTYKDGVDYWNIDVDFFQNRKVRLIQGEFGIKGVYVLLRILTEIYRTSGYFTKWDNDACYLLSDSIGADSGCSSQFIAEAVQGFLRRSFFDRGVFEKFGVLTSAEVQRRFLRIVKNSREDIFMIQEYFLLNPSDRKDVTEATLKKIAFSSIASKENAQILKVSPANFKDFDKEQNRREKNSTEQYRSGRGFRSSATACGGCNFSNELRLRLLSQLHQSLGSKPGLSRTGGICPVLQRTRRRGKRRGDIRLPDCAVQEGVQVGVHPDGFERLEMRGRIYAGAVRSTRAGLAGKTQNRKPERESHAGNSALFAGYENEPGRHMGI